MSNNNNNNNNSYNNFNNSNNTNNVKYNSLGIRDESGTSLSSSFSPSPSSPPPIHHYQPSHSRKGSDLNNSNNSINTNYNINNSNNISSFPQTKSNLVTPVNPKRYLANSQNKFYPNKNINDNNNNNYDINNSYNSNNFNNTNNNNNNNNTTSPLLSNDKNQEKKERKPRSKIHFLSLVCVMSLGFIANVEYGVIMPSIWKYISSLGGNKMQMGVAISACSAAQVCFLPIFGWWSDKRTMKEVYIVAILIGVLGNAMYASAQFLGSPWLIVGGRTLIGIYSGATSVSNSFIACVTTPQTRTRFMAHLNGINALGLVTGPAFNLFLAKIHVSIVPHLSIDDLTSPAWFVGALLCISLLFFMFLFKEPTLAEEDTTSNKIVNEESGEVPHSPSLSPSLSPSPSPPSSSSPNTTTSVDSSKLTLSQFISFLLGSFTKPWGVCFLVNFVQNFDFSVLETVVTLFTTQFYHFNTFQNSLMYSAMSLEMIVIIILTAIASKKVSDRMIIVVGMAFMGAGVILLLVIFNERSPFYVFVIIVAVLLVGMPSQNIAVMSCYSQLIDLEYPNAKQGLYSGVMMVFGSSARIVGPLWGGFATGLSPETHAIRVLASLLTAMFGLEFICTTIFYRKLRTDQHGTKQTEKSKLLSPEIG